MSRFSDSNGKDRRRYDNGNGVQRPLTSTIVWNGHREALNGAKPKTVRRKAPDAVYTLRGYNAWAAKVRESWEPES